MYLKIFSSGIPNQIDRRYYKWFRSTLVLVPLFGVHHTLLLIWKELAFNKDIEIIVLYFDLIFTSFQVSNQNLFIISSNLEHKLRDHQTKFFSFVLNYFLKLGLFCGITILFFQY